MARQKKSLGEFRAGRYVEFSSYGSFGSLHHVYGKVIRVDVERSVVVWLLLGEKQPNETKYPPPKPEEPSSWKFEVVRKKDVPSSWRRIR